MARFHIELTGFVEATYTVDVDAEDETDAKQRAIETAPTRAEMWTVLPSPSVTRVTVFDVSQA